MAERAKIRAWGERTKADHIIGGHKKDMTGEGKTSEEIQRKSSESSFAQVVDSSSSSFFIDQDNNSSSTKSHSRPTGT